MLRIFFHKLDSLSIFHFISRLMFFFFIQLFRVFKGKFELKINFFFWSRSLLRPNTISFFSFQRLISNFTSRVELIASPLSCSANPLFHISNFAVLWCMEWMNENILNFGMSQVLELTFCSRFFSVCIQQLCDYDWSYVYVLYLWFLDFSLSHSVPHLTLPRLSTPIHHVHIFARYVLVVVCFYCHRVIDTF